MTFLKFDMFSPKISSAIANSSLNALEFTVLYSSFRTLRMCCRKTSSVIIEYATGVSALNVLDLTVTSSISLTCPCKKTG